VEKGCAREGWVVSEMARVLFRRSLITEQSAGEPDAPRGSETARWRYLQFILLLRGPIVLARLLKASPFRGLPEGGSLRARF